jgi:hypothetical protein
MSVCHTKFLNELQRILETNEKRHVRTFANGLLFSNRV